MRSLITALAAAALLALAVPAVAPAAARSSSDPCANRLCTQYKAGTPSCWAKGSRAKISRCFIYRASRHYRQSTSHALHIAHRESRFNWRVTNSSSGAAGLYQFMPRTWQSTPYRNHSPYHPKWASLAAMWMWKRGGLSHWAL
jgi:soluble lytic murein transglycosylase-like protein